MVKQRHQVFVTLLAFSDGVVIALASVLAWMGRHWMLSHEMPTDWRDMLRSSLMVPTMAVGLMSMWVFGVYVPRRDRSVWAEQKQVIKAAIAAIAGLVVMAWVVSGTIWQRGMQDIRLNLGFGGASLTVKEGNLQIGILAALMVIMLCAHRLAFRAGLRAIRRRGWNLRHVAVIGCGRLGRIACRTLDRNSWTGIHVAYFISHREQTKRKEMLGRPVLGGLSDLEKVMEAEKPDAVYVAIPNAASASLPSILRKLEKYALDVRIIPDVHPRYTMQSMTVGELDGMPILSYRESPTYGLGGVTKRMIDMLGAVVAMIVFGPIMLLIAAIVRISSPGPVIFKQRRVSLGGEVFNIYKFRTMHCAADEQGGAMEEDGPKWTARNDPRVTKIGAWLRKTSLDELPQLINVISGEMSLVGPRPERPELIERFREDWRGYVLRQHVKAGITGWAQVNGLRGDTSLKKRLQHDLFYIKHWSLGFDIKILWLTIFRGFVHRNAH